MNKYFLIWNRVYSDRSEIDFSDETLIIQNFHFSWKLWWKHCWKLPKLLRCRKAHSFQAVTDINPKLKIIEIIWKLEWKFIYLLCFPRNKPSKSVTIGSGRAWSGRAGQVRFIDLNDSASPKMVIKSNRINSIRLIDWFLENDCD